jgi:hypothetical protein
MRKYIIHYWREKNDDCVDCEEVVTAPDIGTAYTIFCMNHRNFKRVYKIEEQV